MVSPGKPEEDVASSASSSASEGTDLDEEDELPLGGEEDDAAYEAALRQRGEADSSTLDPEDPEAKEQLIVAGPRRRKHVDYKALHAEMFGETVGSCGFAVAGVDGGCRVSLCRSDG